MLFLEGQCCSGEACQDTNSIYSKEATGWRLGVCYTAGQGMLGMFFQLNRRRYMQGVGTIFSYFTVWILESDPIFLQLNCFVSFPHSVIYLKMIVTSVMCWHIGYSFLQLVKLPRSPTVDDILTKYLEYRSKKDGM